MKKGGGRERGRSRYCEMERRGREREQVSKANMRENSICNIPQNLFNQENRQYAHVKKILKTDARIKLSIKKEKTES